MNPKAVVGVVIPTHRFDSWLDEAVSSVLASQGVEFQLIVVVNGVSKVSNRPWMTDERVHLLHFEEALGPAGAMLPALENLKTPFVVRLDADDRLTADRLLRQFQYFEGHPQSVLVGTAVRRIDGAGESAGNIKMPVGDDVRKHLLLSNTVVHSSWMFRRDVYEEVGGYDPELAQMEDYDLLLRLAVVGEIAVLPEVLTEYRIHGSQISSGAKPVGIHIQRILDGRRALGRALGVSRFGIWWRNLIWQVAQFTRFFGITRPGHEY